MIATLKQSSFAVSKHLGLMNFVSQTTWRRDRLLILCYHGVSLSDEHQWDPYLYISQRTLARRFALLAKTGYTVLPLGDAVERLYAGTLPPRAVVLTFDDGFYDFKVQALPLLQRYRYPATVYLTTQRCRQNFPIPHLLLSYLLWKQGAATLDARGIRGLDRVYPVRTAADRERVVIDMVRHMRAERMYPADKDVFARAVASRLGADFNAASDSRVLRIMAPDDVAEMSRTGIDIELHTHRHRTPKDADQFIEEVRLNQQHVRDMTGRTARHFCYPSGVYRASYLPRLAAEGIRTATTCDAGLVSRTSDRLLLPRFVDYEAMTELEFEAWLTGAAGWLPRRARRIHDIAA